MDDNRVTEAFDLLRQGQAQEGMNLLKTEFLKNPNDWRIHYHTGLAWRLVGDLDKAIFSYNRAIQLCPDNEMNFYGVGIAYQLKGDFDNAIESLRKAYELNKNSVQVLNSLGLTYKKKGDIHKALEIYEHAEQTLMGNIFEELKQSGNEPLNDVSTVDSKKVVMINMDVFNLFPGKLKQDNLYCTLQNNIGVCYAILGNDDEARKAFNEAIQFTPDGMDYQAPIIGLRQLDE